MFEQLLQLGPVAGLHQELGPVAPGTAFHGRRHRAAQHYQVLVLTCLEREYRDEGGVSTRLADCNVTEAG